jgi:Rha family phage regulatory protein
MDTELQNLVQQYDNRITTTSLRVAEIFEIEHKDVLRIIRELECPADFRDRNFTLSSYKAVQNKSLPLYFITRDGFSLLAMGFTGKKAAKWKVAFIEAFNRMESAILAMTMPKLIPTYQLRIMSKPTAACPENKWCIFDLSHEVMLTVEMEVGSINQYDLVDGSIGIHWMKYREGKPWRSQVAQYWHHYRDVRGKQLSNCFEYSEQPYFKKWLRTIYVPQHLPEYLKTKFKKDKTMLARVSAFIRNILGGGGDSKAA